MMADQSNQVTTIFFISNLHCPSCVASIEASLATLTPQPLSISHSIISHSIVVRHDHDDVPVSVVTKTLEQAGFEVYSVVQAESSPSSGWQYVRNSSTGVWGLEQAVQRWTPSRKNVNGEESKKRKRHIDQCKQCQEELMSPRSSFEDIITEKTIQPTATVCKSKTSAAGSVTSNDDEPVVVIGDAEPKVYRASFAISGMTCSACVGNVSKAISQERPWVKDVNVVLLSNSASVTFLGEEHKSDILEAIEDAGYDATLESVVEIKTSVQRVIKASTEDAWRATYSIEGMFCSACIGTITNALKGSTWIDSVDVNLISNSATVVFRGKRERTDEVKEMIEDLGYDASLEECHNASAEQLISSEREICIIVQGMYCHHCPERILKTLADTYGEKVEIKQALTESYPYLRIAYTPQAPTFTLRQIMSTIESVDREIKPSVYHPPTIEQRSQEIHDKERRKILLRLGLSVIVAIPTFIIGIVFMSLVKSSNPGRRYLEEPMWAGRVSRAEWAMFILSTIIYFFAADIFHIRTLSGIRALWRSSSPVPLAQRFYRFGSMNMLISIGTSIAYFSSIASLAINATQKPVSSANGDITTSLDSYFDSVVFLTMFLLIGRFLEAYSKARTGDAVTSLGALRPSEALLASVNDTSSNGIKVPIDLLEAGDTILVPHGSTPPFDGTLTSGTTQIDESSLTGESRLVSKQPNDTIHAGTINKGHSAIHVRLNPGLSGTSMLDQIIAAVREGQTRRAPVERVADTLTAHFVPFIIFIGILTWTTWLALGLSGALPAEWLDVSSRDGGWWFWALQFSIAVFVVACPCGIGLASPTALFVGGGIAAREGILVKGGGEAFQEASMLDCVVFDKTGTLTVGGRPAVTEHWVAAGGGGDAGGFDTQHVFGVAKSLEVNSGHPVAAAIVDFCTEQGGKTFKAIDVEEIPGKGLKGLVTVTEEGKEEEKQVTVIIGNESFMSDYSVDINPTTTETLDVWKRKGKSVALLATTTNDISSSRYALASAFAISDPIRPEAASVVQALQHRGMSVWLLSGDNQTTANTVGKAVGVPSSNVIAGVLPEQKADKIKYLQRTLPSRQSSKSGWFSRHRSNKKTRATVAMVGDGINDAPALATADVGIAIGSGSDVALSTASFVLVTSDLRALVTLITLSRAVFRRIWFNFGWALVYNLIALPVAAGVLYPVKSGGSHVRLDPVWASLAMALSSVSVVTSSLALRTRIPGIGFRPAKEKI